MAAGGRNKGKKKLTTELRRKISLGRHNSPKVKALKEAARKRRELQKEIRRQQRLEQIQRWGGCHYSPETRARMSLAQKGRIPWNKGIKAWNNGQQWTDEVKENISRGMVAYWIDRKELESKTQIV